VIETGYLVRFLDRWPDTEDTGLQYTAAELAYALLYRLPITRGSAGNFVENFKTIDVRDIPYPKDLRRPPPLLVPTRPAPAAHFFVAAWVRPEPREVHFAGWASLSELREAAIKPGGPCKVECHAIPFKALHPMSTLQYAIWSVTLVGGQPVREEKRRGKVRKA